MASRPFEWKTNEAQQHASEMLYLVTVTRTTSYQVELDAYSEAGAAAQAEETCEEMWETWEQDEDGVNFVTYKAIHIETIGPVHDADGALIHYD